MTANTTIITVMTELAHRPLEREERQMLIQLSAQGMAKINHDIEKGIPVERTLRDLRTAFLAMRQRREVIVSSLSKPAKAAIAHVLKQHQPQQTGGSSNSPRSPLSPRKVLTTDEILCVADVVSNHEGHFSEPFNPDGSIEGLSMEDYASRNLLSQLESDFHMLGSLGMGNSVRLSHLAPTACPKNLVAGARIPAMNLSVTFVRPERNHTVVGLSPIVCWFNEIPVSDPMEISPVDAEFVVRAHQKSSKKIEQASPNTDAAIAPDLVDVSIKIDRTDEKTSSGNSRGTVTFAPDVHRLMPPNGPPRRYRSPTVSPSHSHVRTQAGRREDEEYEDESSPPVTPSPNLGHILPTSSTVESTTSSQKSASRLKTAIQKIATRIRRFPSMFRRKHRH